MDPGPSRPPARWLTRGRRPGDTRVFHVRAARAPVPLGGAKVKKQPILEHISPFFIVSDVSRATRFYEDKLGFETRALVPEQEPFFAIVGRDSVQIYLKDVSDDSQAVSPQPNHTRHPWAQWDAFVFLADPDCLAQEFASRGVSFHKAIQDTDDGLRGFEVCDCDGYVLFFGRPK